MSALPGDRQTDVCFDCGLPYLAARPDVCAVTWRLHLSAAESEARWLALLPELEPRTVLRSGPGRHARRGSR